MQAPGLLHQSCLNHGEDSDIDPRIEELARRQEADLPDVPRLGEPGRLPLPSAQRPAAHMVDLERPDDPPRIVRMDAVGGRRVHLLETDMQRFRSKG